MLETVLLQFLQPSRRHQGQDPPDCEAIIDGSLYGIEHTEFVHEKSLAKSIKAIKTGQGFVHYHDWTKDQFLSQLRMKIADKDRAKAVKGGPYKGYYLVIQTAEMYLTKEALCEFLNGVVFECSLIDEVFIGLDYHQSSNVTFPAVRLNVTKRPKSDIG